MLQASGQISIADIVTEKGGTPIAGGNYSLDVLENTNINAASPAKPDEVRPDALSEMYSYCHFCTTTAAPTTTSTLAPTTTTTLPGHTTTTVAPTTTLAPTTTTTVAPTTTTTVTPTTTTASPATTIAPTTVAPTTLAPTTTTVAPTTTRAPTTVAPIPPTTTTTCAPAGTLRCAHDSSLSPTDIGGFAATDQIVSSPSGGCGWSLVCPNWSGCGGANPCQ